jgi:hypothetical protein
VEKDHGLKSKIEIRNSKRIRSRKFEKRAESPSIFIIRFSIFELGVFVNANFTFFEAQPAIAITDTVFPKSNEMISCKPMFYGYVANMDWQQLVALAIVAITAGLFIVVRLLAVGVFGRRKFSFERHTHCGCAATGSSAQQGSIVFRARKGHRPEVLVKMR